MTRPCQGRSEGPIPSTRSDKSCFTKGDTTMLSVADQIQRTEKWDRRFLALAEHVAQWSKDPSTKTGAVIVDPNNRVVSLGYNGFPRGVNDLPERLSNRELKYKIIVHCERNALLFARESVRGYRLVISQ